MALENVVQLEKINKSYPLGQEKVHVLKDITFAVDKGDYVAILGASGSGKSTLMNIIGCMDIADNGDYYLNDEKVTKSEEQLERLRNQDIGFIFQNYHLIPQYTMLQNVMLPLLVRGVSQKRARIEAEVMIELVGLEDRHNHRPKELSGGQQQRVAIARALITKPTLLLADEPTGALDSKTGQEIIDLFHELNELGHTIMVITHDEQVAHQAKQIVRLSDGELFI